MIAVNKTTEQPQRIQTFGIILMFFVGGGLIGSAAYIATIPPQIRLYMKVGMAVVSLATWLALGQSNRRQQYRPITLSFFAVSLGLLLAHYFGSMPLRLLGLSDTTVQGSAVAKFGEALSIVLPILIIHFASGGDRDGLFLGGGNLRLGLGVGLVGFAAFAGVAAVQAIGAGLEWTTVANALPWILIFVFSNAFMEELWFRGLFLKKLAPLVGVRTTLVITSIVFAAVHVSSTYVLDILVFVAAVMALALLWGWLMLKTNSIWGAVLIHAGADVLVMIGFLAGAEL